jgi:hypothetical protein
MSMRLVFPVYSVARDAAPPTATRSNKGVIAMRQITLASVVILLLALPSGYSQESAPAEATEQESIPATESLPSIPQRVAPPPVAPLALVPPPPGPPPLAPPVSAAPLVYADAGLDGFATRFWISADYLLWWTKGDRLPPLVTTGSRTDAIPGALGQPGTRVLFGGDYDTGVQSGLRLRGGYWFTPDQTLGVDGSFFFLGGQGTRFHAESAGVPILTRPFFDVNNNREDAFLIAYPNRQGGAITATLRDFLWGADPNLRSMIFRGPSYQLSALGGFRFLDLHDTLRMQETDILYPQRPTTVTDWLTTVDRFRTSNQFYGGQLGTDFMWCRGRFYVDVLTKVALGASVERATINGCSSYNGSDGSQGHIGIGALALPSNIGWAEKDQFAVVPEVGLNLGYAVTRHIRLTCGYTFLYWSKVFRPGDQIDRAVNTNEFAYALGTGSMSGPQRPNFTFKDTDFWAQGINFGAELRY